MRMLVMGGTQFNGLALVHELARCGHDVTIVNRGRTEAPLPDGIHRLFADRTDHDQMRDVLGGLEFDVVLDMSAYHPDDVRLMVELFDGRTGQYVFASSTVVYAASDHLPITEDHPTERGDSQIEYGGNKLLCEDVLDEARDDHSFPSTVVYFSMVYGPRNIIPDREQRMFARLEAGRPVLIPGDGMTNPTDTTQNTAANAANAATRTYVIFCPPSVLVSRARRPAQEFHRPMPDPFSATVPHPRSNISRVTGTWQRPQSRRPGWCTATERAIMRVSSRRPATGCGLPTRQQPATRLAVSTS